MWIDGYRVCAVPAQKSPLTVSHDDEIFELLTIVDITRNPQVGGKGARKHGGLI